MRRHAKDDLLVIGGDQRVDLLPPEVRAERRGQQQRRRLTVGVVGVAVVVALLVGSASALAYTAQANLADEQARTATLLTEQGQYFAVRTLQNQVTLTEAAQRVGASTEIDWKTYLDAVQNTLPPSVTITSVQVDSATPLAAYTQATAPLQGSRVATVSFTATSTVLPDIPAWLTALGALDGFADALPGSVALDQTTGIYTVTISMHINDSAFAHRFDPTEKK
ncbi:MULTISPECIES: hypothetical protein [unclassified Cryobacterium]|uniref:hypothetical protein n=1 Tax=unclassified Cryobacterium TaxID=2649013 RepID=UPI001068D64E|nr:MULTISPECIES: hypothetical protein [unclassified Cryobacterium]TFD06669.1 hypothetical protein E3T29_10450 [Cryobacterium sp. TMT1-66-1]TFD11248.1 hypothetical protein E3T35_11865 [Cryobacterium sp. TMT1-2-2]